MTTSAERAEADRDDADRYCVWIWDADAGREVPIVPKLVESDTTNLIIGRVEALLALWQASPDMRTRAHADRLSEALDGRVRA